jgi:prepilin-type N-terminal cleavage/methylation domain-containing protein
MTSRLRIQDGFTLIEMLVVCVVSLVIFGATMTAFASFYGQDRRTENQSDSMDEARLAMDREARQLRNLANPTYNATNTINKATDYDFIFQTSDPNKTWVRYCLDTSAGASAGKLWMSESPGSSRTSGMTGTCPGTGWKVGSQGNQTIVAQHVTNTINGQDRNVFTYSCLPTAPAGCPASSADYAKIDQVSTHVWIDANTRDSVKEKDVSTGVYLRNQNEAPTAAITGPNTLASKKVSLNGMGSSDPEGRTLEYFWFIDHAPTSADLADCSATPAASVWQGPLLIKDFTPEAAGTTHQVYLVVRDPGCLTSTAGPITVSVPA